MFTSTLIIASTQKLQQEICEKKLGISFAAHPDLLVIDESPSISIETARNIRVWLTSHPYASKKKTVVIFSAERLTIPAQHALLKTLEEPPTYAQIVLTSSNVYALLPTIQSRCTVIQGDALDIVDGDSGVVPDVARIIPSTYNEIFALSEEIGKDRALAAEWCVSNIQALHKEVLFHPSKMLLGQLHALQKTLHLLKHNVHTKLAIESLCFHAKRVDV